MIFTEELAFAFAEADACSRQCLLPKMHTINLMNTSCPTEKEKSGCRWIQGVQPVAFKIGRVKMEWWIMTLIPALGRLRQVEFRTAWSTKKVLG